MRAQPQTFPVLLALFAGAVRKFIDKHGEPFPVGGLLTPDKTLPVLLVELYVSPSPNGTPDAEDVGVPDSLGPETRTGQRYRLLVRKDIG